MNVILTHVEVICASTSLEATNASAQKDLSWSIIHVKVSWDIINESCMQFTNYITYHFFQVSGIHYCLIISSIGAFLLPLDVDECDRQQDGCSHNCVNSDGGYLCKCPDPMVIYDGTMPTTEKAFVGKTCVRELLFDLWWITLHCTRGGTRIWG